MPKYADEIPTNPSYGWKLLFSLYLFLFRFIFVVDFATVLICTKADLTSLKIFWLLQSTKNAFQNKKRLTRTHKK